MPRVLIYRSQLLPISETFVKQHYTSLSRYEPTFAGLREMDALDISDTRKLTLSNGVRSAKLRTALYKTLGFAPDFKARIAAEKPDLIHAHFAMDAADALPIAKALGIPLVVTLHGFDITFTDEAFRELGSAGRIYLAKRSRLFRSADRFLPVSHFIEREALKAGVPQERMTQHYLGIDLTRFPEPQAERDNSVLYVGRLVEKKGLNLLVEALERAGANETGTTLRIIGDGPKREEYLALARQRLKNVEFLGAQPHDRVISELARARLFSMPSRPASSGDNEGLGLVFLEAAAVGTPSVSFAQAGIVEAVKDGETGLLAPTGDVEVLAAHLARAISDPELCARLGTAGRNRVQEMFDIRRCTARLETLYDEVIAAHRA